MTTAPDAGAPLRAFFDELAFRPDPFQRRAIAVLESRRSVVVTAPTGAGKTLIAEAAVYLALGRGERAFYTTPIKALSNQKFADFRAVYGDDQVGLLTGDNVINGDAPIVVMTTEVLRNMIYAESAALDRLGVVVLDEVHYLQDRVRGQVWEEVIIHLPASVQVVALSATIANPEEFTAWVRARRGDTDLVVEHRRPVPLESTYLIKDRNREGQLVLVPVFEKVKGERANPDVERLLKKGRGRRRRFTMPRRLEVVERLLAEKLTPAIYFIFSRAGCDQAADRVGAAGLGLTTADERTEIRRIATDQAAHLPADDLTVLGYAGFVANLEAGVAAHHAGLVPAFKEIVETLFTAGLIKVVFATETLALGINMPARTVVLERLSKFNGETHELLQPGDYTQLTGRAGRRGIDTRGTAVVLHDFNVPFDRVASIAAAGSHPLRSSFRPTFNMAVNLVANYARPRAEELLNASFAQFRAAERRGQLEQQISDREGELAEFRAAAICERGDIWDFVAAEGATDSTTQVLRDFAQGTLEGDVLTLTGAPRDRWVVLARGWGGSPRLLLLSSGGEVRRIRPEQLSLSAARLGTLSLPEPVRSRESRYQRAVARMLVEWEPSDASPVGPMTTDEHDHPVATCPDLDTHLRWVRRAAGVEREIARLRRRLGRASHDLVEVFSSLLRLLAERGYVSGWTLTDKGERLRFLYNELDLLLAESLEAGLFADLEYADFAALATLFTFEARLSDVAKEAPTAEMAEREDAIHDLAVELNGEQRRRGLPETRIPDGGFAATVHDWASGATLDDLFDEEAAAGDFVRNCRQLLDLLRQIRDGYPSLAGVAREAIEAVDRGVVAVGGRV